MLQPQKLLTIGDVAHQAGMKTSALRYYESVGLLPIPERVSGQRRYNAGVLRQIAFIQAAQSVGFSIKEMRTLIGVSDEQASYADRMRQLAGRKMADVDAIDRARAGDEAGFGSGLDLPVCQVGRLSLVHDRAERLKSSQTT